MLLLLKNPVEIGKAIETCGKIGFFYTDTWVSK